MLHLTSQANFIASNWDELYYKAPTPIVSQLIDGNTYYFYPADCSRAQFNAPEGTPKTVSEWRAMGFDASSVFSPCGTRPTGARVSVRPNAYDANRAHIIINNFAGSSTVAVDLSSVLTSGDSFEIRNAQDYFGTPIVSGTYAGGSITIPMAGLTVARPVGWTGAMIPSSAPAFGAFILIKR